MLSITTTRHCGGEDALPGREPLLQVFHLPVDKRLQVLLTC